MTPCPNMETLSAYIDGAVEREEELSLRFHLDDCASCRQKVKVLLALKESVVRNAEFHPVPAALREALRARVRSSSWSRFRLPWAMSPAIAFALLFFVMGGLWWWHRGEEQKTYETIARTLVAAHLEYLHEPGPLDLPSADPAAMTAWFQGRVPFPVSLPQLPDTHLLGGRLCALLGHHGAVVFYEHEGKRLSLFTMAADILPPHERARLCTARHEEPQCLWIFAGRLVCLTCTRESVRAVVMEEPKLKPVAISLLR